MANTALQSAIRHQDLWFQDGSVILLAEHTLFRVHKSFLGRHSVVFQGMFAIPQPAAQLPDSVDGCPVVRLHDASADLAALLSALYDGPVFGDNSEEDFTVVAGVLRLASKYVIERLRRSALAHLSRAWPTTLTGWDAREEITHRINPARASSPVPDSESEAMPSFYPSAVAVILLAREANAPQLLPSALYDLSRRSFAAILDDAQADALDAENVRRLALGKEAGTACITSLIRNMGAIRSQRCTTPAACRKDFAELARLATQHYMFDRERGSADPLYVADELGQLKSNESECKSCGCALEQWAQREREKIWKAMPGWFRLDSWESLGL